MPIGDLTRSLQQSFEPICMGAPGVQSSARLNIRHRAKRRQQRSRRDNGFLTGENRRESNNMQIGSYSSTWQLCPAVLYRRPGTLQARVAVGYRHYCRKVFISTGAGGLRWGSEGAFCLQLIANSLTRRCWLSMWADWEECGAREGAFAALDREPQAVVCSSENPFYSPWIRS